MNLHTKPEFKELITLVAKEYHIPETAVERDYFIVRSLLFLSKSDYVDACVFKGGTSLSKCYPGSIERFSEDIDLTFIPKDGMKNKQIEKSLKNIEKIMTQDFETEIIRENRNDRNKSSYFWYGNRDNKIKLEIGSSVRPDPYGMKFLKTYIQDYLEKHGYNDAILEFELESIAINVLNIERTFLDKIMAVKRHAFCGTIKDKARHIYDVTKLLALPEIKQFLNNTNELKKLIILTKETDAFYLEKRNCPKEYNPKDLYNFEQWKDKLLEAKIPYEKLHEDLLYTDEQQNFNDAIEAFEYVSDVFEHIDE